MPTTRSSTRANSTSETPKAASTAPKQTKTAKKRVTEDPESTTTPAKKSRTTKAKTATSSDPPAPVPPVPVIDAPITPPVLLPAVLTFSYEDAKKHLFAADRRFEDIFARMPCRPFEQLEQVEPFRTLATSILGQQISWLAARSITHRFIRLYKPSLPEKPDERYSSNVEDFFPSPHHVAVTEIATLRSAGLSTRKAEYIKDLAARFADGRLSTQKLSEANDEELAEMLIEVRGIGRWTVDMFAIFSLRRPDILPVGDLGVQRGVGRWALSLHSSAPKDQFAISPKKLPKCPDDDPRPKNEDDDAAEVPRAVTPDASSVPPAPGVIPAILAQDNGATPSEPPSTPRKGKSNGAGSSGGILPTPFTPSINRVLAGQSNNASSSSSATPVRPPPPLPEGLTVAELKNRLSGKKKVKGALLTPTEMEALTESWKPYRSLGVYYMWALVEESAT